MLTAPKKKEIIAVMIRAIEPPLHGWAAEKGLRRLLPLPRCGLTMNPTPTAPPPIVALAYTQGQVMPAAKAYKKTSILGML